MSNSCSSLRWEIKFDMGVLVPFESGEHMLLWSPENVMYFMDLVKLILTRKQWE